MGSLASTLAVEVPKRATGADRGTWDAISALLPSKGLEGALLQIEVSDDLQLLIGQIVGTTVASAQQLVLEDVFSGKRTLRLTRLVPHLLKSEVSIPLVTTNYDTLAEVAFEEAGLGVDDMFVGNFAGTLNEREARMSLLRDAKLIRGKTLLRYTYRDHLRIAKPHGSLNWYYREDKPVRSELDLPRLQRLIIAPGKHKFRSGYDSPFDLQRERANRAIDAAKRLLIVGYGFNDDHLETHLTPSLRRGTPAVLLTRELTSNAAAIAAACPNIITIERRDSDDRSRISIDGSTITVDANYWDLDGFVREVFGT